MPEGAPVELELRLESVMEGVLVTGTARAKAEGECVRCLEPLELELLRLLRRPDLAVELEPVELVHQLDQVSLTKREEQRATDGASYGPRRLISGSA